MPFEILLVRLSYQLQTRKLQKKSVCTFADISTLPSSFSEFKFTLGEGQVIAGWDLGLRDMCVGELRELVVPPQYGYGEFPVGDKIPPRALLVFYVELLKISDPGEDGGKPNMFKEIDVDGDGMISHSEVNQRFKILVRKQTTMLHRRGGETRKLQQYNTNELMRVKFLPY